MERRYTSIHKTEPIALRAAGGHDRIQGYWARYYDGSEATEYKLIPGEFHERIMPGAFKSSIADGDIRGLFNHNPDNLLARTKSGTMIVTDRDRGPFYDMDGDTPLAQERVIPLLRRGDLDGSSFGFMVRGFETKKEDGVRIRMITEADTFDVGPVTFPAYEATTAEARALYRSIVQKDLKEKLAALRKRSMIVVPG